MTADVAIKMGVHVRRMIACINSTTDKTSPTPRHGNTAKELMSKHRTPNLNFELRAKQLEPEHGHINSLVGKGAAG
ncbi:hypothetical protein HDV00_005366 [Rhizophlyctis rosea]|nr:hypothetical protein HDV00_005366 [Rhizophlyctis rosea]